MAAAAAVALLGVSGCERGGDQDSAAAPGPASLPAPAAPLADPPLAAANTAAGFAARMALNDMYETESGRIALQKSQDNDLKRFAQMMVDDHVRTSNEGRAVIAQQGLQVTLPTGLDAGRRSLINELNSATEDFDARYIDQQIQAHETALGLTREYARDGDNEAFRTWASRTASAIENHLQMARGLKREPTAAPGAGSATNNAGA